MKSTLLASLGMLACLAIAPPSQAQDAMISDEVDITEVSLSELLAIEVAVSSTKASSILKTPSTVSIIDRAMIDKYNFTSVADALRTVPGMSIHRTTGRQEIPTSRGILQGHYANKVLIMIDGIPQWNPSTSEPGSLNRVSLNDIERIEVLRGPASVLYGTNAYTGAINLVLRKYEAGKGSFTGGAGSQSTYEAGVSLGTTVGEDGRLFLAANSLQTSGDERTDTVPYTDGGTDYEKGLWNDFIRYNNFTTKTNFGGHSVLFNTYYEEQSKLGVDPAWEAGYGEPMHMRGYLVNYSYEVQPTDQWLIRAGITYDWNGRLFPRADGGLMLSDPTAGNTASDIAGSRSVVFAKTVYDVTDNLDVEFGMDYDLRKNIVYKNYNHWRQDEGFAAMGEQSITEYSAFAQVGYTLSDLLLTAGTRYTNNELFGGNTSSRASAVYMVDPTSSVKFIVGQAFRAPSLFETYITTRPPSNLTGGVTGNTKVEPETVSSAELAYLKSFGSFFTQGLVYYAQYDDKIQREKVTSIARPDGAGVQTNTQTYGNAESFKGWGLELESRYDGKQWSTFANYALTKGDDEKNFKFVPEHSAAIGIDYKMGSFGIATVARGWSETANIDDKKIGAQAVGDLIFSYAQDLGGNRLDHSLSIQNVADATILGADFVDRTLDHVYLESGRTFLYTFQMKF